MKTDIERLADEAITGVQQLGLKIFKLQLTIAALMITVCVLVVML